MRASVPAADGHVHAFGGQRLRRGQAEAARRRGDGGPPSTDPEVHATYTGAPRPGRPIFGRSPLALDTLAPVGWRHMTPRRATRRARPPPPRRHRRRRPVPLLVRRRRRARTRTRRSCGRSRATCASSAVATPGLWTAIIAKERDPSRDVVLIDAGEVGSAASGRNGGFMESSPHPRRRQRPGALPGRDRAARAARAGEPQRHRDGDRTATTSTATTSAPASSTSPPPPTPRRTSTSCATTPMQLRRLGQDVALARRRRDARRGRLADLHRRAVAQRSRPRSSTRRAWCGG